jgi:hypothetical protein
MPDVVVTHGDTEITVPLEAVKLPEGFSVLSSDDLETKYVDRESVRKDFVPKPEFTRRLNSVKDKAHEDETVIARVLEAHGEKKPDLDEVKAQWEKANLSPLQGKYSALKEGLKMAQIREAAGGFFDERFVSPLPGGKPSAVEIALASQFELDDSSASIFPVQDDGTPFLATNPDAHNKHRTAKEHFELLSKDPQWERFLKQELRNAGGSGRPGQDSAVGAGNITHKSQLPDDGTDVAWIKQHGLPAYQALK